MKHQKIVILDFGSQYNQLIARRVREKNVYSVLKPFNTPIEEIKALDPVGIILSGGPNSVYDEDSPRPDLGIFDLGVPILGICYGMQVITQIFGGEVERSDKREYGFAEVEIKKDDEIFSNVAKNNLWKVWMSHSDKLQKIPEGFEKLGDTPNTPFAIFKNRDKNIYGVQFHPEVDHSVNGDIFIDNFIKKVCGCTGDWTPSNFIDEAVEKIRGEVGNKKVILGFSGGVDSSVAALLLQKAIGENLIAIFVDNGLLRLNEREKVIKTFKENFNINLVVSNAESNFLEPLSGVKDPEAKRKIIGKVFIETFENEIRLLKDSDDSIDYLAQGTIYPDIIESVSPKGGPSVTIKSHHNVGGLPDDLRLNIIEPLKELFKDEVRRVGLELGLPKHIINRHPFPGPGLGVRVLEEVTKEKCDILRRADAIFIEEIEAAGVYDEIGQAFAVLLPVKAVGVMGDQRTYENVVALRAVRTIDFMTADWYKFEYELLSKVSTRIINEVKGVNRVVYDISQKPPGTIEWE
ncbi:MAG: glutamine-hydrolyzing GMP synthase [Candidatus Cloacimonadota bacterium]|nr:MAG: glutamine-hydrolyzing GMP synthase [Candidatus Cloacimonadota bacterium]PIE81262.1 MAG: glutamine-hydrolyzing GMP synthase [Candidatus Delongbacteria bacterium]